MGNSFFKLLGMECSFSKVKVEPPPSPTIAIGLNIYPSTIRFVSPARFASAASSPHGCDRPQLTITFTNPTPYLITFKLAQTPPHVARFFHRLAGLHDCQPFHITDLDTSTDIDYKRLPATPISFRSRRHHDRSRALCDHSIWQVL
jgi:hypothetical protein